jgi:hypothetical protein
MANGLPVLPEGVNVFSDAVLLIADAVSIVTGASPQWGLYLDGVPVVVADNVVAFGFKKSARISKHPQEQGAFASYNKVSTPAEPILKFSTGGSVADRQAFLASIAPLIDDLNLYDVVTPEVTYPGYNVIDYDYPRTADRAGLITVEVRLEQIVVAGASAFSNTASPTDAAQTNNGLVQGQNAGSGQGGSPVRVPITLGTVQ